VKEQADRPASMKKTSGSEEKGIWQQDFKMNQKIQT